MLERGLLEVTFRGGVTNLHSVGLVLVGHDAVRTQVDDNFSIATVLGRSLRTVVQIQVDTRLVASVGCVIVGLDLVDFGEQLSFTSLGHFSMPDGKTKHFLIIFDGSLLDHFRIVVLSISQLQCRSGWWPWLGCSWLWLFLIFLLRCLLSNRLLY